MAVRDGSQQAGDGGALKRAAAGLQELASVSRRQAGIAAEAVCQLLWRAQEGREARAPRGAARRRTELATTLNLDGTPDKGCYEQGQEKDAGNRLAGCDYAMHGKVFKYDNMSANKV